MNFSRLIFLILSDLYRYNKDVSAKSLLLNCFFNPGFKCTVYYRICRFFYINWALKNNIFWKVFFFIFYFFCRHNTIKYGIEIPYQTDVGEGFHISHFGCIVIGKDVKIGNNCNISQGITIGASQRGSCKGSPVILNDVYIGPGAKIFGSIIIGNNVAIGANCVVTKSVENNAVVVGVPGKVISYNGSSAYVNNIDYGSLSNLTK